MTTTIMMAKEMMLMFVQKGSEIGTLIRSKTSTKMVARTVMKMMMTMVILLMMT